MSINKLLKKYKLKVNANQEILFNDFIKIINIIDINIYLQVVKNRPAQYHIRKNGNNYYIHTWDLCRFIINTKRAKDFYEKHKEIVDTNIYDKTKSIAEAHDNKFIYLGTLIKSIIQNNIYYFDLGTIKLLLNKNIKSVKKLDTIEFEENIYIKYTDILLLKQKTKNIFLKWIKNTVIVNINNKLNKTEKNSDDEVMKLVELSEYNNHYIVYLIKVRDNTYKYGDSYEIARRMMQHKNKFKKIEYIRLYKFDDFRQMKNMSKQVKVLTKKLKIDYKDSNNRIEMFKTTTEHKIKDIANKIDQLYDITNRPIVTKRESDTLYNVIDILTNVIGYEESMEILNTNKFEDDEYEYIQAKIFNRTKDIALSDKTLKDTKHIRHFCTSCKCDECIKMKTSQKKNTDKCIDCNKQIPDTQVRCFLCQGKRFRKVERPPYEQLMKEIKETSYVIVGKKYKVTDNTIKKWVKVYRKYDPSFETKKRINKKLKCNKCGERSSIMSMYCRKCSFEMLKEKNRKKKEQRSKADYKCIDCKKDIKSSSKRCVDCYRVSRRTVTRPTYEEYLKELRETSYVEMGRKYGVRADNIQKWEITYKKELNDSLVTPIIKISTKEAVIKPPTKRARTKVKKKPNKPNKISAT